MRLEIFKGKKGPSDQIYKLNGVQFYQSQIIHLCWLINQNELKIIEENNPEWRNHFGLALKLITKNVPYEEICALTHINPIPLEVIEHEKEARG